jgi:PAS domain S-box-containing protein
MGEDRRGLDPGAASRNAADARDAWPVTARRAAVVFAAVCLAGTLSFALPHWGSRLNLPILPSGFAVAALVRWGRRLWPAVFAAELAIELYNGTALLPAVVVAAGLPAGAWLTAWILERRGFDRTFARARDVPLFVGATIVGMALAALIGNTGLTIAFGEGVFAWVGGVRWWNNTVAGVMLLGPLLLSDPAVLWRRLRAEPWLATGYLLGVAALAVGLLTIELDATMAPGVRSPLIVASLVLVVIGVMRLGLAAASVATLVLATCGALSFAFDRGMFAGMNVLAGLILVWSYAGALTLFALILTALLAERDAEAAERLRAERRYAEVFEASPQPLWVHHATTLRFLLVNRATERQYGYPRERLLSMRASELAAPGEPRAVPDPGAPAGAAGEPFETRHATASGRILEVEMWTRAVDFGGEAAVLAFATDVTERQALGRALIEAIASEQRRIGQEMHDGLGQELTGLSLSLRALAKRAQREQPTWATELDRLAALLHASIQSARRIVRGLSPLAGADGNLVGALEQLAETSSMGGLDVRLDTRLEAALTLPLEARSHLYRIAQEALQNALKHAGATRIELEFGVRPGGVRLAVLDNGRGPPEPALAGSGLGMRTMRYRATAIGGRLLVARRLPTGTAVVVEAPQPVTARAQSA